MTTPLIFLVLLSYFLYCRVFSSLLPKHYLSWTGFFLSLIFISALYGQNYSANIYGFPVAKAKFELRADSVKLKYETVGIIDMIWPAVNTYSTHFDPVHFGLKFFRKKIKQEDFKQKVLIELKNGILKWEDETRDLPDSTQTMFTLFARLTRQPYEILDTRWFDVDHEGRSMRGRFLWAGTKTIKSRQYKHIMRLFPHGYGICQCFCWFSGKNRSLNAVCLQSQCHSSNLGGTKWKSSYNPS